MPVRARRGIEALAILLVILLGVSVLLPLTVAAAAQVTGFISTRDGDDGRWGRVYLHGTAAGQLYDHGEPIRLLRRRKRNPGALRRKRDEADRPVHVPTWDSHKQPRGDRPERSHSGPRGKGGRLPVNEPDEPDSARRTGYYGHHRRREPHRVGRDLPVAHVGLAASDGGIVGHRERTDLRHGQSCLRTVVAVRARPECYR